ncbi:MAG TPA: YbhB/YbcL family Raf kinase inhibitor-like protein [Devosia sp.]|jgi:Raf kinase inhibitor-like YbhB/YbcL family protein|nr:YbhB/YbcL family Raf kinase inhibitor-like protein [Devosia sp.]
MSLSLMSPAFSDGAGIPEKYSRDGDNLMPPLKWTGVPEGSRSLALVVEDPDAPGGMFHHLAAYNIPADRNELDESTDTGPDHAISFARNDFGNERYDGPEPPRGDKPHHYHFRLAALDVPSLSLPQEAGVEAVWAEAERHMIEEAELVGTYQR